MNELMRVMSNDMKIMKYPGESSYCYKARLIYSAICEWMRISTQDKYGEDNNSKSKQYLLARCSEVLRGFLECEPECLKWFIDEDQVDKIITNSVRSIREKMICAGELVEVGEHRHVTVPHYTTVICTHGYSRIYGFLKERVSVSMVGITRIMPDSKEDKGSIECNHYDIGEFIEWVYERNDLSLCDDISKFEFFDIRGKRIPSESWIDRPNKDLNRHLGRITIINGSYEYWILKYMNGQWYGKAIEGILQDYKEERRILLGLRSLYGTRIQAEVEYKSPVVLLRLFCGLPLREEIILDTYAWPRTRYNDKVRYVVPCEVWDLIRAYLNKDLGIEIRERG